MSTSNGTLRIKELRLIVSDTDDYAFVCEIKWNDPKVNDSLMVKGFKGEEGLTFHINGERDTKSLAEKVFDETLDVIAKNMD